MNRPHSVICCWKCEPRLRDIWRLVASFGIDADGYQSTAGKIKKNLTPIIDTRRPWLDWTHKRIKRTDDLTAIPGRAVTAWTISLGVELVAFNPPEPAEWLRIDWLDVVNRLDLWCPLLLDGHAMRSLTVQEIERLMENGWDFSTNP